MKKLALLLLLVFAFSYAQEYTEGGNVTHLNMSGFDHNTRWDGLYGEAVTGGPANYSYLAVGHNITELNVLVPIPGCNATLFTTRIVAYNSSALTLPLSVGNLAALDAFIGLPAESGTATFNELATLTSTYGTFTNVPSLRTLANGSLSPYFREYYMNDGAGNLVFIADIVSNRLDWNGSTSDYQIILPANGSAVNYTIIIDRNYTCGTTSPEEPGPDHDHVLYVFPPGVFEVTAGSSFTPDFTVENRGDFTEHGINVTLSCPAGFSCGTGFIGSLGVWDQADVGIPITVDGPGEYVLTVCASNDYDTFCQDFLVRVVAECLADSGCPLNEYCDSYSCEPEKPPLEPCARDGECSSGLCDGGICVLCQTDSDCGAGDHCASSGMCQPVICACGQVSSHACMAYQCCADADCGSCSACSGNSCLDIELSILVVSSGDMVEGDDVRVQVTDNLGREVQGATVFTDTDSTTADAHGYASITIPYDGLIYARTGCGQAGIMLDVIKIGHFVLPEQIIVGQPVDIQLVDKNGLPIAGAVIEIDGRTYTTDGDGRFRIVFDTPGEKTLRGTKAGYRINEGLAPVLAGRPACGFPIVVGWFLFYPLMMWQLWALAIVLAIANIWLLNRRIMETRRWVWKLLYTLGALILALPDVWILNICFMTNVVVLQFIFEVVLFILKKGKPYEKDPYRYKKEGPSAIPPIEKNSLPKAGIGEVNDDEDTNDG
jgi:hypothetical protein